MATRSKALVWTGVGLCVAGAVGLVVGGALDVDAADPWASVAGGAAGLFGLAVTLYALLGPTSAPSPTPTASVTASGPRSVAAGGAIGSVATGDGATATPPPTMPAPATRPATGPVTASGERSVAAGGDIGSVSTGDA
ncbi:hypothetical protein ACFQ6S_23380 [Streptomyces sp. NPDC056479]|uniref:hypothetical protein n=1 Tax=Streptomyces sp. NPDC056479 TaxID=3345832 RepID=UPI0036C975D9